MQSNRGMLSPWAPQDDLETQAAAVQRLGEVMAAVSAAQGAESGSPSLAQLEQLYTQLWRSYREEYVIYNLAAAALAQVRRILTVWVQGSCCAHSQELAVLTDVLRCSARRVCQDWEELPNKESRQTEWRLFF
jgi:hypothetical protein